MKAKKEIKKEEVKDELKSMGRFMSIQDIFTLLNTSFGLLSVFFSIKGEPFSASVFLIVAVLWDYLDGKVGRMLGKSHEFGKELDSISDIVSFGVAPAVFGFVYAGESVLLDTVLVIFVICGSLRLARFNITNLKGMYQGMPITMNGLIIPIIYFAMLPTKYYFIVYLVSSALMISSIRIRKIL